MRHGLGVSRRPSVLLVVLASVLSILVPVVVRAVPAQALGSYDNAAIADNALSYVGQWGGNACRDAGLLDNHNTGTTVAGYGAGQCRTFVNCILKMVSGGSQYPTGTYFQSFLNNGGVEITSLNDLRKGDIVQSGDGVHTFIIVGRVSGNIFDVVDSNHDFHETVMHYQRTVVLDANDRAFRMGTVVTTPPPPPPIIPIIDGVRFAEVGNAQQYISWRGASLPISYADAVAYDNEGDQTVVNDSTNYLASHPSSNLPPNTVLRPVGQAQEYLYAQSKFYPIGDPPTASCLMYNAGQPDVAVVPTMWSNTIPVTTPAACSLNDGTRFVESGSNTQYISWAGVSQQISYGDAVAYDTEGNHSGAVVADGYVGEHSGTLPVNRVVRPVGGAQQYLYDGSQLRPIDAPQTSSCLLYTYGQAAPYVVPTMWSDSVPVGPGIPCTLPDGTRFTEVGSLTQYISWAGASLEMSYGDAQAFDAEGNRSGATMADGYVNERPATALPAGSIVRPVGQAHQYVYTGSALDPIGDPTMSSCLLSARNQATPYVVPTAWSGGISIGAAATCGSGPTIKEVVPPPPGHSAGDSLGYDLVASDGGIFSYGDAQFYGSTGGMELNQPIVGMARTPDHAGYWLVASDGGIFAYGDAQFYGSTGGMKLV